MAPSDRTETPETAAPPTRIQMLGLTVDLLDMEALNQAIAEAIRSRDPLLIGHHNLHSLYLAQRDADMRRFYTEADIAHVDGMQVVTLARFFGEPAEAEHRVTYVDWIDPLMALATDQRWRVFHLGGEPGVAERAAGILRERYPGLILSTHHGYFDTSQGASENDAVLAAIRDARPQLLLVGMGMPRQERWVLENRERLDADAILMSGACFDYVAGAVPTPPRWAGAVGLEWLFRLAAEPSRLARRYLIEPWGLLPPIARELRARRAARRGGRSR